MSEQQQGNKQQEETGFVAYSEITLRTFAQGGQVKGRLGKDFIQLDVSYAPQGGAPQRAALYLTLPEADKLAGFIKALTAHGKILNRPKY